MFGMFSAIAQAGGMAGQALQQSGAEDAGQALSGAANPFQAGMQFMGNSDVSTGNKLLAFTGVGSFLAARQAREAAKRRQERKDQYQDSQSIQSSLVDQYWADNTQANAFANGGFPLANLAYVDNGELMRDLNGNIQEVPSTKGGTDAHLMDVGNVESILSNDLMIPGTKETFADKGRSILAGYKPSKNVGATADITDMLNDNYVQSQYTALLQQQEDYKMKQGIKPKNKSIPGYAIGTDLLNIPSLAIPGKTPDLSPITNLKAPSLKVAGAMPDLSPISGTIGGQSNPSVVQSVTAKSKLGDIFGNVGNVMNALGTTAPILSNVMNGMRSPEQDTPQGNVNAPMIQSAMARRRMNIDPLLETMEQDRAISRYNMANINPNTGANQAYGIQSAVDAYIGTANAYSTQSNTNNSYLGEYASIMNNLGQQYEANRKYTEDINAQNREMQRNYFNTAASQIGQLSQVNQQMSNQKNRDAMLMPLLSQYLSQGYDGNTIQALQRQFYGRAA